MKSDKFLICAFVAGKKYKEVLKKYLLPSLKKLNIEPIVIETENTHNWHRNVAQKPLIALQVLEEHKDANIVLLDADCTVEHYPELFHSIPSDFDIALYTLDWNTWYRNNNGVKEVLSGTLFLRNCDKVKSLCKEWYNETIRTGAWEQRGLARTLVKRKDIKVYDLPIEYCWITSLPNGDSPHVKCDNPVIKHYQVSRTLKRGIL